MVNTGKGYETIKKLNVFLSLIEVYKSFALLSIVLPINSEWFECLLNILFKPLMLVGASEAGYLFFVLSVIFLVEFLFYKSITRFKKGFFVYVVVINVVSWITTFMYIYVFGYIANF